MKGAHQKPLKTLAEPTGVKAESRDDLQVYSVTKHRGFVPSLEYFKKQVFSRDLSNYTMVEAGEFAYATIHLDEGAIGIAPTSCLISPMYTAFRLVSRDVLPNYLIRYLKSPIALAKYSTMGKGSAERRRSISFDRLGELLIPLPPLAEQLRIAAILDKTDELRAKRRTSLQQVKALTQVMFLEMFGDPATNPKGFERRTLGELIDFVGGSQPPRSTFTYEPSPEVIRLVQIRDFKTDEFKTYIPRTLAKRFFDSDDVMIGRYGPPLFQILRGLSGSYNVALIKATPKIGVSKDFIFHLLQEKRLHSYVVSRSERTAGQTGVNLDLLSKYPAYLPPQELQQQFLQSALNVDRLVGTYQASAAGLNTLLASLEHHAFTGAL